MRNNLLYIVLIFVIFLQSCSDFLEVDPQNTQTSDVQFSTLEGQKQVLSRAYFELEALISSKYYVYPELVGGNITVAPNLPTAGSNAFIRDIPAILSLTYNYSNSAQESDFNSFYQDSYQVIFLVNKINETINNIEATESQKNQIKAEAIAIRATTHFLLLQIFAHNYDYTNNAQHPGIIYLQKTINPATDFPSRSSVSTCYELLKEDFNMAINLFQNTPALNGASYAFFNINNTKAMLARVLLEKKEYNNLIPLAQDIITNSGVSLMPQNLYVSEWEKPTLPVSEVLLEFAFSTDDSGNPGSTISSEYFSFINTNVYDDFVASEDLFNLYETSDVRRNNFITQNLQTNINGSNVNVTYRFTKKFQDNAGTIFIRMSEIYLILAEAYARNDQNTDALNTLNIVRNRAGSSLLNNSTNILEEIFNERRRELCFEPFLLFDIARYKKPIIRGTDCISNCFLGYPSPRYIQPFPAANIMLNPNLDQNESY